MPIIERYIPTLLREGLISRKGELLAHPLSPEDAVFMGFGKVEEYPAPVFVAGRATSTFDLAWELAASRDLPPWSAVLAMSQTSGRGQVRRAWHSPSGNLYVSFFLPPDYFQMESLAALALGACIRHALWDMGISVVLKWPNDLLLTGPDGAEGKFGGLLLEERNGRLLAGLGLNLKSAPDTACLRAGYSVPAMALPEFGGSPGSFWLALSARLRARSGSEMAGGSQESVRRYVEDALAWKGRRVYAEEAGVCGDITGIALDGSLLLRTEEGIVAVGSGSITPR